MSRLCPPTAKSSFRTPLLSSCALAAIAALTAHSPARAQLQGTPTVVGGSADVTNPGAITNIAPRTIINWSNVPDVALPANTTQSFDGGSNFIVLNRLLPTTANPTQLNGIVNSSVDGVAGRGHVWFYSPNGLIVGSTGRFNVGSLLLSSNNVTDNDFLDGDDSFTFSRTGNATIDIQPGAQISARDSNSYVALIAPRVRQGGDVTVNGSAAYVAAEELTMTITGSLFDIQVARGSGVSGAGATNAAVVHDGTTTLDDTDTFEDGYGGTFPGGPRNAIFVAVPKNDAITMLVSGSIDYTQAQYAEVVDNRIILSGGFNINNGLIGGRSPAPGRANILIGNGIGASAGTGSFFGPSVEGEATGTAAAVAVSDGVAESTDLFFGDALDLRGEGGASFTAQAASSAEVSEDLILDAFGPAAATRRTAEIVAAGGSIIVRGSAFVAADTQGSDSDGSGGDAQGGIVRLEARDGGGVFIGGDAFFSAEGSGGGGIFAGGNGLGGDGFITALADSSIDVGGTLQMDVSGFGGSGEAGGNGTGGNIDILAAGGTIDASAMRAIADGTGGTGFESGYGGGGSGGDGLGGDISLVTASATLGAQTLEGTIDIPGFIELFARGFGFNFNQGCEGFCAGGAGTGGAIDIQINSGRLDSGDFRADAEGRGDSGNFAFGDSGTAGSPGIGGSVNMAFAGGDGDIGFLSLAAAGTGGNGGSSSGSGEEPGGSGGSGGAGEGGDITLTIGTGSAVDIASGNFFATGEGGSGGFGADGTTGGAGGAGGSGTGGSIDVFVNGGELTMFGGEGGFDFEAEGLGGFGGEGGFGSDIGDTGGVGGAGGFGRGGTAWLRLAGGSASITSLDIDVEGDGGGGGDGGFGAGGPFNPDTGQQEPPPTPALGGDGGDAQGGGALVEATAGGTLFVGDESGYGFPFFEIGAQGDGGSGGGSVGALGGDAVGGTITLRAAGGTIDIATDVFLDAGAEAGEGSLQGGNAQGGSALIQASGAGSQIGIAGFTELAVVGGTPFDCCSAEGIGGTGTGGTARIEASDGALIDFDGDVELIADGIGGSGFQGGDGFGGIASILAAGSDIEIGGDLLLSAASYGGFTFEEEGGYGNGAGGGLARLEITSPGAQVGRISLGDPDFRGSITLDVSGNGGSQDSFGGGCGFCERSFSIAGAGGPGGGGNGQGGTAEAFIDGLLETGSLALDARGIGGAGAFGDTPGHGGNGIGGSATVDFRSNENFLAFLSIDASGFGGEGASAFNGAPDVNGGSGGSGTGGGADDQTLGARLFANGGIATIEDLVIEARGQGGAGGDGAFRQEESGEGVAGLGGSGGNGQGGFVRVDAGLGGQLEMPAAALDATGTGGDGGDGSSAFSNGNGGSGGQAGNGAGGTAQLGTTGGVIFAQSLIDTGYGSFIVEGPTVDARGFGGEGGFGGDGYGEISPGQGAFGGGGGGGGDGTGGIALADVAGGSLNTGPIEFFAGGEGGNGGQSGFSPNGVIFSQGFGGDGTGGRAEIRVADGAGGAGVANFGVTNMDASGIAGDLSFFDFGLETSGTVVISETAADETGSLTFQNLFATARGDNEADHLGFELTTDSGPIAVNGDVGVFVDQNASFEGVGTGSLDSLGSIQVFAGESILLAQSGAAPGAGLLNADGAIFLTAQNGSILGSTAGLTSGFDSILEASENIEIGAATAGDDFEARTTNGDVVAGNVVTTGENADGDGSNIVIEANGEVTLDNGDAADAIRLTSATGSVNSGGLLQAIDLVVNAAQNIALTDLDIVNDIDLTADNGFITGRNFASQGDIRLDAAGTVDVDGLDAGAFVTVRSDTSAILGTVVAGADIDVAAPIVTVADATAGRDILLAGGSVTLTDGVAGRDVDLNATGAIQVGFAQAGDDFTASAGTTFTGTRVITTGEGEDSEEDGYGTFSEIKPSGASRARSDKALAFGRAGSNIIVDSVGALRLDNGTAVDFIDLVSTDGSIASAGLLEAGADIDLFAGGGIAITDATSALGEVNLEATQSVSARNLRSGASTEVISETGDVTLASVNANLADIPSDDIEGFSAIAGGGTINIGSATADNIGLGARGAVNATNLNSGDLLLIFAGGATTLGTVSSGGLFYIGNPSTLETLGGFEDFDPAAFAALPQLPSGGNVTISGPVTAGEVSLVSSGALSFNRITSAGDTNLVATNGVSGSFLDAGGAVNLEASGGAVVVSTDLAADGTVDARGRSVSLTAIGPLTVRTADATAGNVALNSGGLLALNGDINGVQIALNSTDLAVGASGRVGTTARTTGIEVTANNGTVVIGGSGAGSGYRLDNTEFGRFAARDVTIRNSGQSAGIQIDTLGIQGSNVTGRFLVASNGNVDLVGALSLSNAGTGNSIGISAGNVFRANTAGGSIAVTGSGGALAGSVDVTGRSIIVASDGALADVNAADTVEERDDRLGQNDGAENADGYIRAGAIRFTADERLYVQNSGINSDSPDDRRGITAGTGGITIVATGEDELEIIINGRQDNGNGGFITGEALIPEIDFQGGEPNDIVAPGSTVNGCLILGVSCDVAAVINPPIVQDVLEDLLDDDGLTRPPVISIGQLIEVEGGPLLPVIDDPVTSTGNDDIWAPANPPDLLCPDDEQDCAIDDPVTGTGNEELQRGGNEGSPPTSLENRPDDNRGAAPVTGTGNEDFSGPTGE